MVSSRNGWRLGFLGPVFFVVRSMLAEVVSDLAQAPLVAIRARAFVFHRNLCPAAGFCPHVGTS